MLASNPQEHGLCPEDVQSYVHVMFGLSKDWCASGLRVGCLWTLNAPVQKAMQNLSYFSAVSGVAQHMLADMLDDTAFVKTYLKENLRRLGAAYDTLAGSHLLCSPWLDACSPVACSLKVCSALSISSASLFTATSSTVFAYVCSLLTGAAAQQQTRRHVASGLSLQDLQS